MSNLDLSERNVQRFKEAKAEMDKADPDVPDLTDEQFMKTLLDTLVAVQEGYYE